MCSHHICSPGTSLEKVLRRSKPKPGAWLVVLTWALNLAESWGGVSLPNTLYLGLCDRKRGGGFLEEKEVPSSRIRVKFRGWWTLEREGRHVSLWTVVICCEEKHSSED